MKKMNRFRNKGLWLSILAFVPIICQQMGAYTLPHNYADVVNGILGVLVVIGILNNPKTGNWYLDKENKIVEDGKPVEETNPVEEKEKIEEDEPESKEDIVAEAPKENKENIAKSVAPVEVEKLEENK